MVLVIGILLATSVYLIAYQLVFKPVEETHLPTQAFVDQSLEAMQTKTGNIPYHKPWVPLSSKYKNLDKRIKYPLDIRRKLIKAGSPMGALEFLAFFLLAVLGIPIVALILVGDQFPKHLVLGISLIVGILVPLFWLSSRIRKRQLQMRKDLPNVIDLLNICVSGGLDFMLAVARVIRDLRPCDLTMEMAEMLRETQMGATRKEALKNFAWRIDMAEVYSFVRTLVQADRMGTSIGDALKIQSEEMRVSRFQRGEAMAMKAPLKLLFPLFVFILPVVLTIVAGPVLLKFLRGEIGGVKF